MADIIQTRMKATEFVSLPETRAPIELNVCLAGKDNGLEQCLAKEE